MVLNRGSDNGTLISWFQTRKMAKMRGSGTLWGQIYQISVVQFHANCSCSEIRDCLTGDATTAREFPKKRYGLRKGGSPPLQTPGKGGGPPFESPPNMVLRGLRAKKKVIFESATTLRGNGHKNYKHLLVSSLLRVWVNA